MLQIAEIPLLDWSGPRFLVCYVTALVVLWGWCAWRARKALGRFESPDSPADLADPYQLAYLAGGAGRVAQLAVARLVRMGHVKVRSALFSATVHATIDRVPADSETAERLLLEKVIAAGARGLPLKESGSCIAPGLRALEVRLATCGLRPTAEERRGVVRATVLPLALLLLLGVLKLLIGLARERPVLLLLLLLIVTVVAIGVTVSSVPRLTPGGNALLAKLRARNERERRAATAARAGELDLLSMSLALCGPAAIMSLPMFAGIHKDLRGLQAGATASSGGGCSSGCSSGCGGGGGGCSSGCGGCGGGGD